MNRAEKIQAAQEFCFGFVCGISTLGIAYGIKIREYPLIMFSVIVLTTMTVLTQEIKNQAEVKG